MEYMKEMKFHWPFRVALLLFILPSLLSACIPRMTVKETAYYKLYENIGLSAPANFGTWTKTDIHIPKGAIVAVMAKGEIWNIRHPGKRHWQPYESLRFKVGEDGREIHIGSGIDKKDPYNLNVVPSGNEGFLYFGMGTWWRNRDPMTRTGKITVRVIIWEKNRQDQIESDLLGLIRAHPKDQQFRDLIAFMANCLGNIREYQKVENLYKMMKENPEIEWDRVFPTVLNHLSDFERSLGGNEKAKAYLEESLKSARRYGNRYMESMILRRLAMAASNQKNYEEANLLFEQSFKIAMEINNPEAIGFCLRNMGQNLLRMNKPAEAVEYLERSLEQFRRRDRVLGQRWAYLNLGEAYMRLNKNMEAKKSFESAVEVALKAVDPQPQWMAHQWLGRMAEREGDEQSAFEHYARAITIVETMRAKYTDPSLKVLFMKDKLRVYERMIKLLYKMQRAPEALHYLERARARVMLDMLAEKAFSSKNKEENELLIQERALRKQIDEIFMEQEKIELEEPQEAEEGILEAQEPEGPISELERLQVQYRAILERIEKLNPELASLVTINPLKASEIQALLDGDTVLLEYFMGQDNRFIFVVTSQKVLAVLLKIDSSRLFEKIKEFRERAVEGITLDLFSKAYEKPLLDLYEVLIQPIEEEISNKKNLVIVPHGMLHYLPFQALLSKEGKYLLESFNISYLPSASVLKYARAKNKGNRVDLLAVGNPATGLSPLPAAEVEVKEVSAMFEKKLVLTGQQATKNSVESQGPQYDMILLSTHGEMIESNPLKSNLRFTPSENDDGKLTVSEIFDMEIKANLVTLSACETALERGETGDFPQGDDLVGLSRAFIHAGAPSVVASLWKVSDDSTVELMKAFYRNLKSMPKSEALRKAQLDLMKSSIRFHLERNSRGIKINYQPDILIKCSHPFFWAPFILVGDWR
jgi:CHAT domain-containing protein/tetratricopeptide (TPR) repeat protein